jgi:hypothetical protein
MSYLSLQLYNDLAFLRSVSVSASLEEPQEASFDRF